MEDDTFSKLIEDSRNKLIKHQQFLRESPHRQLSGHQAEVRAIRPDLEYILEAFRNEISPGADNLKNLGHNKQIFRLVANLRESITFFRKIENEPYGSSDNTRQALSLISSCIQRLDKLSGDQWGKYASQTSVSELKSEDAEKENKAKEEELLANRLYRVLRKRFDLSDLGELSFELNIDYEDLAGRTKKDKALNLVKRAQQLNRLNDLAYLVSQHRPDEKFSKTNEGEESIF